MSLINELLVASECELFHDADEFGGSTKGPVAENVERLLVEGAREIWRLGLAESVLRKLIAEQAITVHLGSLLGFVQDGGGVYVEVTDEELGFVTKLINADTVAVNALDGCGYL